MKRTYIPLAFICTVLWACSSAKQSTGKQKDEKVYSNLFIVANTADIIARIRLEKESAAAAEAKGYKTVKSIDVLPPSIHDPKPLLNQEFMSKAKETGCDGLLVIYYIRQKEVVNFIPGTKFEGTDPLITSLVAGAMGYKGTIDGPEYSKNISTPGNFKVERGFYIFSGLMDATSEAIIYSEKSELFDDANLEAFSSNYMASLIKHLEAKRILPKRAKN